jgi:hypothetical protein
MTYVKKDVSFSPEPNVVCRKIVILHCQVKRGRIRMRLRHRLSLPVQLLAVLRYTNSV